ncbi:MAG: hypothetical protein FWG92_06865 [Leptospirales bacterium]|nr:hypothetical protein [Leptospirales bacterium]
MNKFIILCAVMFPLLLSCGGGEDGKSAEQAADALSAQAQEQEIQEQFEPITLASINGQWHLMYPEALGYEIQFNKNYSSLIILYLGNHTLLFKGVYTIEEDSKVRINIYEMKRSESAAAINRKSGFTKIQSSYFLFQCHTVGQNQNKRLVLRPLRIIIDGNDSDGFFEPVLRLKKR